MYWVVAIFWKFITNIVKFRSIKKFFRTPKMMSVNTNHLNFTAGVTSYGRYELPKTPILGLVSNFSHFAPGSTRRIYTLPKDLCIYDIRQIKGYCLHLSKLTRILRNVDNSYQIYQIRSVAPITKINFGLRHAQILFLFMILSYGCLLFFSISMLTNWSTF